MKIHADCRPCLIRQMETTARAAGAHEAMVHEVREKVMAELERVWDDEASPPAVSAPLYRLAGRLCGVDDPFRPMKVRYTGEALDLLPGAEEIVAGAADPFEAAVRISIAGNVIDFGTGVHAAGIALGQTLTEFLGKTLFKDDIAALKEKAAAASTILYIGDNAGETVFDRPLLGQLGRAEIYYAAKGGPVINDATVQDAEMAGINHLARLISTGSRAPGTILEECSDEFKDLFQEADLVISKGQGNFETLTEMERDGRVFMLFTVKCPVAADHLGAAMGDIVVMRW